MDLTANPVIPVPTLSIPGGGFGVTQAYTIYTVSALAPERIESVYMVATFPSNMETNDVLTLKLIDQSGVVVYEQPTPPLLGVDGAVLIAYLTWSRLGNDTSQLPAQETLFQIDNMRRTWCNMRLPDLVLQPGASLLLTMWIDDGGESAPTVVSNIAVTVTRNAGAVSDTTEVVLNTQPILVAGPS